MELRPRILDLFSGAGGMSLGFEQAGYDVVGGVDNWAPAVETFQTAFPAAEAIEADMRKLSPKALSKQLKSDVDVIVGGPSCQGFSTSGGLSRQSGRDQSDPRNQLFLNYLDIVDELQPSWVVFENVPGLLLYDQGKVAIEIVRAFREIGYSVAPMILLAADFGVPQLRRRLFFVGNRTESDIVFPAATHGNSDLWADYALPFAHLSRIGHGRAHALKPHVSFDEACSDLPEIAEGEELDGVRYGGPAQTKYQREMRKGTRTLRQHSAAILPALDRYAAKTLKPGENWRALPKRMLPPRFQKIRPYDATTLLKRLRGDLPTYTITTKFNEATTGAFIHPWQNRTLSLREAARIQSFPDRIAFAGSVSQARHQIGNAVPVLLARAIAEAIYADVVADIAGLSVDAPRDVIRMDNSLTEGDILQLKAPRKAQKPELLEMMMAE